jgi:hypothetical protein
MKRITRTLHEDKYTYMIISCPILLRMRIVSDKSCRENQSTHFMFNNFFSKMVFFMRWCVKYHRAGQATDYNTAPVHCMLDN